MSKTAFFFGVGVIALLIISLYQAKYGARTAQDEIKTLNAQITEAERVKTLLEAELAHASRREWLETYARDVLGMRPATAEQFARETDLTRLVGPPSSQGAQP